MIELLASAFIASNINYDLIKACSKNVHPITISAIIEKESGFNQFAIGVNNANRLNKQPTNLEEAISIANDLLDRGINIDLGLGQINSNNLKWLNLSVSEAFDSCSNISAIDYVLNHNYKLVFDERFDHESNLKKAVSMYNTGSESRGFNNGYVLAVTENAINQLRSIPLGSNVEAEIISKQEVFPESIKEVSPPLQIDNVSSFQSYDKQSVKNGENNSRKRSEHINDVQEN